jgi:hypothetical protein
LVSLNKLFQKKSEIREKLKDYDQVKLSPKTFTKFVNAFHGLLPSGIDPSIVRDSLRHLAGTKLTGLKIETEAWRLLGNVQRLKDYYAVPPWTKQQQDEWVPLQIIQSRLFRTPRGKIGHLFRMRILAGLSCPLVVEKFWSQSFGFIMARRIGFTQPSGPLPFRDGSELVQLRLFGLVEPDRSDSKPDFEKVKCPASMVKHNKKIIRDRQRGEGTDFRCPYEFIHQCYLCPIGYAQGERTCPVAVHPATYVKDLCERCGGAKYHDPSRKGSTLCVDCQNAKQFER